MKFANISPELALRLAPRARQHRKLGRGFARMGRAAHAHRHLRAAWIIESTIRQCADTLIEDAELQEAIDTGAI